MKNEVDSLAAQIAGPAPTPIERTLAEVAAVCWMQLRLRETIDAMALREPGTINSMLLYEKMVSHAHRRLMTTLRTLAVVRKLALPAIQVNIAQNQVNGQIVD